MMDYNPEKVIAELNGSILKHHKKFLLEIRSIVRDTFNVKKVDQEILIIADYFYTQGKGKNLEKSLDDVKNSQATEDDFQRFNADLFSPKKIENLMKRLNDPDKELKKSIKDLAFIFSKLAGGQAGAILFLKLLRLLKKDNIDSVNYFNFERYYNPIKEISFASLSEKEFDKIMAVLNNSDSNINTLLDLIKEEGRKEKMLKLINKN